MSREDPVMSDEQERGRDPGADETRQHQPFNDDDGHTRADGIQPQDGPRTGDDRTRPMPSANGDDATVVTPGGQRPDGTSVLPAARDWTEQDRAWAGRAAVRPKHPDEYGTAVGDWEAVPPPEEPRGRWWMPILVGILALLVLGLLGWGIYLIVQNSDDGAETPAPAPSVTAPATTEPTTTAPTTRPTTEPTTTAPTTQPTATAVTVPALIGLSQQEAQQALDRRGLNYRLIFRASDAPAGTVIDSDPAEGQEVPPDTRVALVIAAEAATQPTTPGTAGPDED
jgi:hypothetical protein